MYRPEHFAEVCAVLVGSHTYRVEAFVFHLDDPAHKPFMNLPSIDAQAGGQVNGDRSGRTLEVTFSDPDRKMHPIEGVLAAQYLIRINYVVDVPGIDDPVVLPVFTGPLVSCVRTDYPVKIIARGKGALHQRRVGKPFTIPKGTKKTEAIKRIAEAAGELRSAIDLPDRPTQLSADLLVRADDTFWHHETELAHSMDLLLGYNGAGRLVGRPEQTEPHFTLATGKGGFLTAEPNTSVEFADNFYNVVEFHYGKGKDADVVEVRAPEDHPLSAERLAWHGKPREKVRVVHKPNVSRRSIALSQAHTLLDRGLLHTVKATAECKPFPFIEQGDMYSLVSRDVTTDTIFDAWTLPLLPGNSGTLGWSDVRSRGV